MKLVNQDDLKDKVLLIATTRNTLTVKEVYNLINDMPIIKIKEV
jgi:hypothetical protein